MADIFTQRQTRDHLTVVFFPDDVDLMDVIFSRLKKAGSSSRDTQKLLSISRESSFQSITVLDIHLFFNSGKESLSPKKEVRLVNYFKYPEWNSRPH